MNRVIVLAIAIALAPVAWGQLYKYTDKDGKVIYTDQPPANADSKEIKAPAPGPTAPAKSAAEKAPAKTLGDARPAAAPAKADQTPLTAEQKEARCQAARANYVIFLDDGPITMRNTRTGERTILDEKQVPAEKAKAKAAMDSACKKD
jgi:hypothetical protein